MIISSTLNDLNILISFDKNEILIIDDVIYDSELKYYIEKQQFPEKPKIEYLEYSPIIDLSLDDLTYFDRTKTKSEPNTKGINTHFKDDFNSLSVASGSVRRVENLQYHTFPINLQFHRLTSKKEIIGELIITFDRISEPLIQKIHLRFNR